MRRVQDIRTVVERIQHRHALKFANVAINEFLSMQNWKPAPNKEWIWPSEWFYTDRPN